MATKHDILTTPQTGYNYIDALLASGPDWNFLTSDGTTFRTTLSYSFATDGPQYEKTGLQAFNQAQQAAAVQILQSVAKITGISFQETANPAAADLHFAVADIIAPDLAGVCYADYRYEANAAGMLTSYTADAYIYLDTGAENSSNLAPLAGQNWGYQALLHEIGHALGLKHPFEAADGSSSVLKAPYSDTTATSIMSYTHTTEGYYSSFNEYDLAALQYLYGTDGLRGDWGIGTSGLYLVDSSQDSSISLPDGRVTLADLGGSDAVYYDLLREDCSITPADKTHWLQVNGPGFEHTIAASVEYLEFSDGAVVAATPLDPLRPLLRDSDNINRIEGTTDNEILLGNAGNDTLLGNGGSDLLDGGSGIDTAIIQAARSATSLKQADNGYTLAGLFGETALVEVERLAFSDTKLAIDLATDQSAGMAVLVTAAAFGRAQLADRSALGQLISQFDSGKGLDDICSLIVSSDSFTQLTGGSDAGLVDLLYLHVAGITPSAEAQAYYLGMVEGHGGDLSQADLLASFALSAGNQHSINLVGLQQTGLVYL